MCPQDGHMHGGGWRGRVAPTAAGDPLMDISRAGRLRSGAPAGWEAPREAVCAHRGCLLLRCNSHAIKLTPQSILLFGFSVFTGLCPPRTKLILLRM